MAEAAALVVALSAQLSKFQKDMESAVGIANDNVKKIEDSFGKMNPDASGMLKNFAASAEAPAREAGFSIGSALVVGIAAAVATVVTKIGGLIDSLSKIGDRAEELRLPVNILQSLSVAADAARLPQEQLNKALERFTDVSKKNADDAEEFYTALRRAGSGFESAFKSAPTQEARLRIVSNALKSTADEATKMNLAVQAFGTDAPKVLQVLGQGGTAFDDARERLRKFGLEIDESAVKRAQEAKTNLSLLSRVLTDEFSSALTPLIPTLVSLLPLVEGLARAVRDFFASFQAQQNRPTETLQNEISRLQSQVDALEKQRDDLMTLTDEQEKGMLTRAWENFYKTVDDSTHRSVGEIDAGIEKAKQQIDAINELIRERKKTEASSQESAKGPGAFPPRPSLKAPVEDAKTSFESQIDSINRHIAALNADASAIGKTAAEHEALRTEMALLQAIERDSGEVTQAQIDRYAVLRQTMTQQQALTEAGIRLNKEHADSFGTVVDRMTAAKQRADDLSKSFQGLNNAAQFAGTQFLEIFDALREKTASASEAMRRLTNNILRALEQALLLGSGPLAGILGTSPTTAGGTGGLIGTLLKGFTTAAARQSGGPVRAGSPYVVGEHGPELFVPKQSGQIVPSGINKPGMAGGYSVVVNNYTSKDTETKQSRQQGPNGEMLVIDIVKRHMAEGGFDSINRARFGLRAAKVR